MAIEFSNELRELVLELSFLYNLKSDIHDRIVFLRSVELSDGMKAEMHCLIDIWDLLHDTYSEKVDDVVDLCISCVVG